MIAITTRSSISVKPLTRAAQEAGDEVLFMTLMGTLRDVMVSPLYRQVLHLVLAM